MPRQERRAFCGFSGADMDGATASSALRPAIYWFKRAILSGAYFESPEARDFTFRHAYWYRTLVEREIKSLKK